MYWMDNWNRHMHVKLNSCGFLQQAAHGYIKYMFSFEISRTISDLYCDEDATITMLIITIKSFQKETVKMSHDLLFV